MREKREREERCRYIEREEVREKRERDVDRERGRQTDRMRMRETHSDEATIKAKRFYV